ncbi:MAG: hypothetical protein H0W14_12655, partial [Actinobacteria bacterium]|nr:hypothetical protein [Actinomycetota bacterium]
MADLGREDPRPDDTLDEDVDQVVVDVREHASVTDARRGLLRIHVQTAELLHGDGGDRVHNRIQAAERSEQALTLCFLAQPDRLDDDERLATNRLRDLRDRGELEDPPHRGHLVRQVGRPGAPDLQDLCGPLDREPEDPRVDLLDREEVELDRGHDREGPAAAAERPEEVRLVVAV